MDKICKTFWSIYRGQTEVMKVSDYVAKFLTENDIKDLFLISGGGIMHLLDSVAKQEGLNITKLPRLRRDP